MAKLSRSSSFPWKTLLVGGLIGYLLAIAVHMDGASNASASSVVPTARILSSSSSVVQNEVLSLDHVTTKGEEEVTSSDGVGIHEEKEEGEEEEEEEEEEEGEEEEEHEPVVVDTTVTIMILFLIVLTIVFEEIKESIEEAADRAMGPVIEGLFGELTVLGFLNICTFCITKLGWFDALSIKIFGKQGEKELLEMFEMVHYMLFFIMVFFVINVLVLLRGGQDTGKTWWNYNRACRDKKYMEELDEVWASHSDKENETTYPNFLFRQLFPIKVSSCFHTGKVRQELQLFRGLRKEFVSERSVEPPFQEHSIPKTGIHADFDFGRYLMISMAHELGHIVHLRIATWIFLAGVTAVFYVLALFIENDTELFAWIWVGTGWLVFLFGTYFDYHMVKIIENMSAIHLYEGGEEGALLSTSVGLPKWTRIDLVDYMEHGRSCLARLFVNKKGHITRQDTLYWFERKGPKVYMILFQVQLVFTAAYVALLVTNMLPYMVIKSEQTRVERWGYVILAILPIFLLLNKYQVAVANLTMACSIGVHRRPQVISQVIREEKVARIIRAMVTMQKLQHAVSVGFTESDTNGHSNILDRNERLSLIHTFSSAEMDDVNETFDTLDIAGDGNIESGELGAVLKALGTNATEESLKAMVALLDENSDGSISREEFIRFYKKHIKVNLDHHGLHELAKNMFHQIDANGSGAITLGEFKAVLESFNAEFTVDEIGEIVNELDFNDDGVIGEHEFVRLLENHRLLFERVPLPKLQ